MLELLKQLLGLFSREDGRFREILPILRAIIHCEALTEAVRASRSPVDDLVLRILRVLVPQE
ncbi:MAG TPA: hypothetical protein VNK04_06775 [Gemmataceae bacterium]|nr:hypothetical protein [Gemmataceae bacterium]